MTTRQTVGIIVVLVLLVLAQFASVQMAVAPLAQQTASLTQQLQKLNQPQIGIRGTTNFDALTVTGAISHDGGTPVALPTVLANVPNLAVQTPGGLSVAGTPVSWPTPIPAVATATPQSKLLNNETTGQYVKCLTTAVTGSATATPIAGATPVGNPISVSLESVTGDAARGSGIYAAGTFTIAVANTALTPAPNTTPVNVTWCYLYTKAP